MNEQPIGERMAVFESAVSSIGRSIDDERNERKAALAEERSARRAGDQQIRVEADRHHDEDDTRFRDLAIAIDIKIKEVIAAHTEDMREIRKKLEGNRNTNIAILASVLVSTVAILIATVIASKAGNP